MRAPAAGVADGPEPEQQHLGLTLAAIGFAALAFAFAIPLVLPALPQIQREYDASASTAALLITGFMLTAAIATPIIGRLGDMFGKDRLLVLTMAGFALGALVTALASSIEVLILGRMIQGVGAGVFPLAFGIVRDEFPPERVSTGVGLIGAIFGMGALGLAISGVIVDQLGLEWIFWSGVFFAALAVVTTWRFVPPSRIKTPATIDWGGAALMALGLVLFLIAITQANSWGWTSARVLGLFAAGLAVLTWWVAFELRQREPLVPIETMRRRGVLIPHIASFLVGFSLFGSFILIAQFVQAPSSAGYGFSASATAAGLFLAPSSVGMFAAGTASGWVSGRLGGSKIPLIAGAFLSSLAYASVTVLNEEPWMIYMAMVLNGLGNGLVFAALPNLVIEAVDQTESGVATGVNTIMRMAGGSLGGQIGVSIVVAYGAVGSTVPDKAGFEIAFTMQAVVVACAGLVALALPPRSSPAPVRAGPTPPPAPI